MWFGSGEEQQGDQAVIMCINAVQAYLNLLSVSTAAKWTETHTVRELS